MFLEDLSIPIDNLSAIDSNRINPFSHDCITILSGMKFFGILVRTLVTDQNYSESPFHPPAVTVATVATFVHRSAVFHPCPFSLCHFKS